MAIVAPDTIGFTDIGRSSIQPRDTYARPAMQQADQTLGQLADAAAKMGVKFNSLAEQQGASQEQLDAKKIDLYTEEFTAVRKDIKEGGPIDAQINAKFPQQSASVRAEIARRQGERDGQEWINTQMAGILQDPRSQTDPLFVRNSVAAIKAQALKNNPDSGGFYTNGYLQGVNATGDNWVNHGDQAQAEYYRDQSKVNLAGDALANSNDAVKQSGVIDYQTVADSGQDFTVLKNATIQTRPGTVDHLNAGYATKLQSMVQAAQAAGVDVKVFSGYRDEAVQAKLYNAKVQSLMDKGQTQEQAMRNARRWVAPPGGSQHNHGEAVDLKYGSKASEQWVHEHAADFGLYFPMAHEPWHIEQIGGRRSKGSRPDVGGDSEEPITARSPTDTLKDTPGVGYDINKIIQVESGGNPTAQNPGSSAGGLGQFTDDTWLDVARATNPALRDVSDADVLKLKKDASPEGVAFQRKVLEKFTDGNAKTLERAGVTVNDAALYAAHTLGAGTAAKVLSSADNVPLKNLIGAKAMASNPQWAGMTVAEYKAWAAGKMGQPVSASAAGQNAIRRTDYVYAKTMPLNDLVRRDIYSKTLVQAAISTGDASYLDRMPPEYMTPTNQLEFAQARKQIDAMNWENHQRAVQADAQQRAEKQRGAYQEINEALAQGKEIDPTKYTDDNEVFNYAVSAKTRDVNINPIQSQASSLSFLDNIGTAVSTGDYSRIDPSFAGKTPTPDQIRDVIAKRNDMSAKDKLDTMAKVNTELESGAFPETKIAKEGFNSELLPYTQQMSQSLMAKLSANVGGTPVNFQAQAKSVYDSSLRRGYQAFVATHGHPPVGQDAAALVNDAKKDALTHVDRMFKLVNEGSADKAAAASPTGKSDEEIGKQVKQEQWAPGPDNVIKGKEAVPDGSGNTFSFHTDPNGKVVVVKNPNAPTKEAPKETPKEQPKAEPKVQTPAGKTPKLKPKMKLVPAGKGVIQVPDNG